ncbi:MAG: DMT family transporter [Clostridium sp.]
MNFIYYLKIQSNMVLRGLIIFCIVSLISILVLKDITTWGFIKIACIIIPMFVSTSSLVDIYENKMDGILFSSLKPKHEQVIIKFLYGWGLAEVMVFVLYIVAYFANLEDGFLTWIYILIYSTFLSSLGFFISVFAKTYLVSIIVPLAYWAVQLLGGIRFNEVIKPVSIVIGMELNEKIIWSNIIVISLLSIVFCWISLWILSKGEKFQIKLRNVTGVITVILACILIGYTYFDYKKDTQQYEVINNKLNNSIYVLETDSDVVKDYLKSRGFKYISISQLTTKDLNNNIVYITSKDSQLRKAPKFIRDEISNIRSENNIITFDRVGVSDIRGFRILDTNNINPNKSVIYMYSDIWDKEQLDLLFNKKEGNFVAVSNKILAESNYSKFTINNLLENIELYQDTNFIQSKNSTYIKYRNKEHVKIGEILDIWNNVYLATKEYVLDKNKINTLQLYEDKLNENNNVGKLILPVKSAKNFKSYKTGGMNWINEISILAIENMIFKNVKDEELRYSWSYYYYNRMLALDKLNNINKQYIKDNYEYDIYEEAKEYINSIHSLDTNIDSYEFGDDFYIGSKILDYILESNKQNSEKAIKDIGHSVNGIYMDNIVDILSEGNNSEKVEEIVSSYQKAKSFSQLYNTKKTIYK